MVRPAEDVNRMVRTVIEAADPALRPVAKLRRFVVKRIEFVAPVAAEEPAAATAPAAAEAPRAAQKPSKPQRQTSGRRKPAPRETESSGLRK
jgi:hypothetical protein